MCAKVALLIYIQNIVYIFILMHHFFRQKISLLKALLCFTTAAGVLLVVQPTFLFKHGTSIRYSNLDQNFSTNNNPCTNIYNKTGLSCNEIYTTKDILQLEHQDQDPYIIGVAVGFSCAFASGLSLVLSSKVRSCPNHLLMIVVGLATLLVGMMGPLINLDNRFLRTYDTWKPSRIGISLTEDMLLTSAAGTLSLVGSFVLIYASQIAPPTLVSTIRSCEILLALLADNLFLNNERQGGEEKHTSMLWLVLGALLVLTSAILMTVSDWIEKFIDSSKTCNKGENTVDCKVEVDEYDTLMPASVQTTVTTIGDIEDLKSLSSNRDVTSFKF